MIPDWRRRGAAVAEFAAVAPILALFMMGMLELGRAVMVKESLTNAARKGCRTASLPGRASASVVADVSEVLEENNIPSAKATVTVWVNDQIADARTAKAGDKVSVQVAMRFAAASCTIPFFLANRSVASEPVVMVRD